MKRVRRPAGLLGVALTLIALLILAGVPAAGAASTTLVVNEIDYDQPGTDAAEYVEIKNVSTEAIDLDPYTLLFVNGSTGVSYATIDLPAVSLAAGDYFVVCANAATVANCDLDSSPETNFIQNGEPDAVAIILEGAVVDTVSYEGDTAAPYTEGSGAGLVDTAADSTSISRCADGADSDQNNVDLIEVASTPGAANACPVQVGVLVINEIDYDQASTDTAEYVEIANVGSASINLSNTVVELVNGTGGGASVYATIALPAVDLSAGDYFVICANAATTANCDLDVSPDTNLVQNGDPDAIGLKVDGVLVDAVSYEGDTGAPYTEGSGVGLVDDPALEASGLSRCPDGTDTNQNNVDFAPAGITPGSANVCPAPAISLVINEIDYDQPGTDAAEFLEIKNVGNEAINLDGFKLEFVNGNAGGAAIYDTIILPAASLAAGDYFVVCANAATVANCDLDDGPDTNFIQNGAPDAVALLFNNAIVDTVSYEGDTAAPYTEGSGAGLEDSDPLIDKSIARCPDGTDTDQNNVDLTLADSSPGEANLCPPPGITLTIMQIQGAAQESLYVGQNVVDVAGIVTAVASNGFYFQDPAGDGDVATSDALFVFTGSAPAVAAGDAVLVDGTVAEFTPGGLSTGNLSTTELTGPAVTVASTGNPLPAATVIGNGGRIPPVAVIDDDGNTTYDPTLDGLDFYESLEAMLVQVNDAVAVGPTNRFGEIPVVGDNGANALSFTPRGGLYIQPADFNPERIILDDALMSVPTVDTGDSFTGPIVGVLDYNFGNFKLLITAPVAAASAGLARETTAAAVAGELSVAAFNVENLDPFDEPARIADLASEIVANLQAPDIVGLVEIQDNNGPVNDGTVAADQTYGVLIAAIAAAGGPTYEFRDIAPLNNEDGGEPGGNIRVGFIFRPDRVTFVDRPGGTATTSTTPVIGATGVELSFSPGRIDPTNLAWFESRKPLAGEFLFNGEKVFVAVNHFNSKGGDNPLFGRIQPPILISEIQRLQQAEVVNDFVESILALDPAANVMVIGDLNDFQFSAPLAVLRDDDLTNLVDTLPAEEQYTYIFDGNSQVLDHILVTGNLLGFPWTFDIVHANADFDTNERPTDHEPLVGQFCLDTTAPTLSASATPNMLWPPNHKYRQVEATYVVSDDTDPNPSVVLISVTSDEPDSGTGDDDLPNDIIILDDTHFRLRAERAEWGDGRIYTITYQATDACGNSTLATATVTVPHSLGIGTISAAPLAAARP